jgi:hypothetical protein
MGRQILFHMLPEDCEDFLEFVQRRNRVLLTPFLADFPEIQTLRNRADAYGQWLCLWNQELLSTLLRRRVHDLSPSHRVEDSLPLLQLETYAPVEWREACFNAGTTVRIFSSLQRRPSCLVRSVGTLDKEAIRKEPSSLDERICGIPSLCMARSWRISASVSAAAG